MEPRNKLGKTEAEIIQTNKKLGWNEDGSGSGCLSDLLGGWEDPHFYYVTKDDKYNVIELKCKRTRTSTNPYWIGLDRIKTKHDLLHWIFHLSEKNWVTSDHINKLILIMCKERAWNLRR